MQQHDIDDDQTVVADAPQGADGFSPEDVESHEVREDGMVIYHLKDGTDKELKTPKRVTNQPGSETVQAALALAKAMGRSPDEIMAAMFARPQAPPQSQPTQAPDKAEPDPFEKLDADIASTEAALEAAFADADSKQQAKLTRELSKLEAARTKEELRQEHAQERQQTSQQAKAEAALEARFERQEARAFELIPELANKNSPEFHAWAAIYDEMEEPDNPMAAYTAALELKRQMDAAAPPQRSALRQTRQPFEPPRGVPRGRTVVVNPMDLASKLTPAEAHAILNGS